MSRLTERLDPAAMPERANGGIGPGEDTSGQVRSRSRLWVQEFTEPLAGEPPTAQGGKWWPPRPA